MKKRLLVTLLTIASVVSLVGCGQKTESGAGSQTADGQQTESSVASQTLKIGLNCARPLLCFEDDNGELTGYETEVLKAIDEKLDQYDFEFVNMESSAVFVALDAGDVDFVSANLRRSAEREAKYIHTYRGYNYTPYRVVVLEENNDIKSLADLAGKKAAVGQGSLMATLLEGYAADTGADIEIVYSTDMVGDLISGRVDAVIGPQYFYLLWNKSYENVSFKNVGEPLVGSDELVSDNNAYIYFQQGDEEIRDAVSEAIYELREEGKLSEISVKYFGEDLASQIDVSQEESQIKSLGK